MSKPETPRGRRSAKSTTKKTSAGAKSKRSGNQDHVCSECGKVCKSAGGLTSHRRQAHPEPEPVELSAVEEVDAAITGLGTMTATQRVLAADLRLLAEALQTCAPSDKAKTSKELRSVLSDLMALGPAGSDDGDSDGWDDIT